MKLMAFHGRDKDIQTLIDFGGSLLTCCVHCPQQESAHPRVPLRHTYLNIDEIARCVLERFRSFDAMAMVPQLNQTYSICSSGQLPSFIGQWALGNLAGLSALSDSHSQSALTLTWLKTSSRPITYIPIMRPPSSPCRQSDG